MTDDKTPPAQVWPSLRARDARRLIRFLVDVFGFEETVVYGEGDIVQHCQLSWPEGGGIMLGSMRDEPGNPWELQPGSSGAYVVSDHVDEIYRRTVAAGATILRELNDTDYGSHEFAARDPEGNLWSFGTYRGEPRSTA
jgi:uncharacterized glyoxalase superfamily protein PhnB